MVAKMRRFGLAGASASAAMLALALASSPASAADKVSFLTSWFAQAEHGGFSQAKATGLYEKAGLDVNNKMGRPQVNGSQLLLAGETQLMHADDIQILTGLAPSLPLRTRQTTLQ